MSEIIVKITVPDEDFCNDCKKGFNRLGAVGAKCKIFSNKRLEFSYIDQSFKKLPQCLSSDIEGLKKEVIELLKHCVPGPNLLACGIFQILLGNNK